MEIDEKKVDAWEAAATNLLNACLQFLAERNVESFMSDERVDLVFMFSALPLPLPMEYAWIAMRDRECPHFLSQVYGCL